MKKRMFLSERKAQIVRVAMRLFAGKGFRGTTTADIAEAAGINQALIFRHFRRKEDLYKAIIQEKIQEPLEMGVSQAMARQRRGSPEAARRDDFSVFSQIASHIISENAKDASFLRLLLFSALEGHPLSRLFFEKRVQKFRNLLSRYIQRRTRQRAFVNVPPRIAARAFMGMVIQYAISHEIFGEKRRERFPQEQVVKSFVEIFLLGMRRHA